MAGYLIDRHAQLEATDSLGQTPLHLAITSAEDIFLLLLDKGADIHARKGKGQIALQVILETHGDFS